MAPPKKDFEDRIDDLRDTRRHGSRGDDDRGERPSWRDLDRKRDRSNHSDQDRSLSTPQPKDRYQSAQAQKALKSELEGLFGDNQADPRRETLLKAEDRVALEDAVNAYLDGGGLPADSIVLEKALDVRKDATLRGVVAAIGEALPSLAGEHQKMLLLKMRTKKRRTFDAKLGKAIQELLDAHGVQD
jgi:hypothetical protein